MDLRRLTKRAKDVIERRGGIESVKGDAAELKDIVKGEGGLEQKAKAATQAVRRPGASPSEQAAKPKPTPGSEGEPGAPS